MSAIISKCGKYRYLLTRESEVEQPGPGPALFLMLNPSTADATLDDPTIRRCRSFAKSWGCAGVSVANLYAYRATKPADLWLIEDPVGPDNDALLRRVANEYGDIVCAWGANAKLERVLAVADTLINAGARLWCFGTTKGGQPLHPLYLKRDQPLIPWSPPGVPNAPTL